MASRQLQKSAPPARPRRARWKAWLCALTNPGNVRRSPTIAIVPSCAHPADGLRFDAVKRALRRLAATALLALCAAPRHRLRIAVHIEPFEGRNAEAVAGDVTHLFQLGIADVYVFDAEQIP